MRHIFITLAIFAAALHLHATVTQEDCTTSWNTLLGNGKTRIIGSKQNEDTAAKIEAEFKASGLSCGSITFNAPAFRPGRTSIKANGKEYRIYPMAPGIFRPGNFKERHFECKLAYAGFGSREDLATLKGVELDGAILLMEFDCGQEWLPFFRLGIKGIIFIENPNSRNREAKEKLVNTEVNLPRFMVRATEGAELKQLAVNGGIGISVDAEPSRLENVKARSPWVIIPGKGPLSDEAVLITAALDSNSIVPDFAPGAQGGANLMLLMETFRSFTKNPPARTTVICAVNAHTSNHLGERNLAWNLLMPRSDVEKMLDIVGNDLRLDEMLLSHYSKFNLNPPTKEDSELIIRLRNLMDSSTGKNYTVKEPIVDMARREVNLLKGELLHLSRDKEMSAEEMAKRRAELDDLRHHHVNVLTLFNKVGVRADLEQLGTIPLINPDGTQAKCTHDKDFELNILRKYVSEIVSTHKKCAELNRQEISEVTENNRLREELGTKRVCFTIDLELDWGNAKVGFASCDFTSESYSQHRFGLNVAAVAKKLDAKPEHGATTFLDTMTRVGGQPEVHYFREHAYAVKVFQMASRTPSFGIRTPYSSFGRRFTPSDTFDNLDATRVAGVINYTTDLLHAILGYERITWPSDLKKPSKRGKFGAYAWASQIKSFKFDDFSASVLPQIPVPNSVIILYHPDDKNVTIRSGDVANGYVMITDERASATFVCLDALTTYPNAFAFDKDFTDVTCALDVGEAEAKIPSLMNRGEKSKTLALFNCVEYPVYVRDNPALIGVTPITEYYYLILNGRLNSQPKKFGFTGALSPYTAKLINLMDGPAAIFLEKHEPLKLISKERALALNTSEGNPLGKGFTSPDELGSDFFATAINDMSRLNEDRLRKLAGTSDELSVIFRKRGDEAIAEVNEARKGKDWPKYLQKLHLAVGAHIKAYKRMTSVTNDMLKAVVFYLALMLPFCFFAEKLIFKFKKISHEMAAFALMFALTFCVFRLIHPAFKVAQAPEAIFIAFIMGGLGLFVIKILHGRFEGEMQLIFRSANAFDTGQAGFSTAGQSAMIIGVNNMKRRRIRTALTTATVILVTFTMLAFTSISKNMNPTIVTRSDTAPYNGLMYTWPGNSRMDEPTVRTFIEILGDRADVNVRRWLLPSKNENSDTSFRIFCQSNSAENDSTAIIDAILGLPQSDKNFLGQFPLHTGNFFSDNNAKEVILPQALAKALGIHDSTNDSYDLSRTITLSGTAYKIVGILDDKAFSALKDLNQHPLTPIKAQMKLNKAEEDLEQMAAGAVESGDDGIFYVDLSAMLIMPEGITKRSGALAYSISARLKDGIHIWNIVDDLLTITNASKFYISSKDKFDLGDEGKRTAAPGVYYIGEGYRTSIGGLAFLLIPLLISGTIILNTMLGSVFERKAEIAIYNAVGLNPTHIGMFFLAEAFVYSVIGSIGGYLIGQCTSIVLTRTHLVSEINLNFSSLSVVYVILFTIAVVLLSTIYPSIVATRAAVPSGKRKWSLPAHDGKVMHVVFPFIYHEELIHGINAYLDEYFSRFTEASFGDLIANLKETKTGVDADGRETLELIYDVALAPFDLGVTQELRFIVSYDTQIQAYRLTMINTRLSGQDSNWTATNMPFLERMRTYLMHWRNLSPAEHSDYVRRGKELFSRQ